MVWGRSASTSHTYTSLVTHTRMAAVLSLQGELKKLGSLSKRHSSALAHATENSLAILERECPAGTGDRLAINALRNNNDFVTPFILACSEASAKSCASALQCIQTLAMFRGIAPARLGELLAALMEATQLGLGIQLKILQVLPVILFEFSSDLSGPLLVELLAVCTAMLGSNKVTMVHNTAYATLQQLINGIFDRTDLPCYERMDKQEIVVDDAQTKKFLVKPHLHDSSMVLVDLCAIADNQPPKFTKLSGLSLNFTLELIELTLSSQAPLIHKYDELAAILRIRVVPLLLRLFSEATDFPIVLRVTRLFYLLLRQHLRILATESEVILATIAQRAMQQPIWKRSLSLEVLHGLLIDADLVLEMYNMFDGETSRVNIIQTIISDFATSMANSDGLMLASELTMDDFNQLLFGSKPETSSSTSLANTSNAAQANTSSTSLASTTVQEDGDRSMILGKQMSLNVPIVEMLDRVEPPKLNRGYPYYQILRCINSFADVIHKVVPVQDKATQLLNDVSTPLLQCFSIGFGIAMDLEQFRLVVRAVQRLAHASGIIAMMDTRDEFIRLLSQNCTVGYTHDDDTADSRPWVLARCSLVVRALFNLGYALGNQLGTSWTLITGTITQLKSQITQEHAPSVDSMFGNCDSDYRTINLALRKLMESSAQLSDQALVSFMTAMGSENESVKYEMLQNIAIFNEPRLANPDSETWEAFSDIVLKGILCEAPEASSVSVLNHVSEQIVITAAASLDVPMFDRTLAKVARSISKEIECVDPAVKIVALQHLNNILEKFGAKFCSGWESVLDVVSVIPHSNNLELLRCAFITLELICSDFLENLPYSCVFDLTLCLYEYSRQNVDLNTSFTSVSLFWSLCDHLMNNGSVNVKFDPSEIRSEQDLLQLAKDTESESGPMALWLLAVIKLASIAGVVEQHQVRTSSIQIFLRLFNTHGSKISRGAWDTAHLLALPKLLESARSYENDKLQQGNLEVYTLVVEGINDLDNMFLPNFHDLLTFREFWKQWIQFLNHSVTLSPQIALVVYQNLNTMFTSKHKSYLKDFSLSPFWIQQNPRPRYSVDYPKQTSDALRELVGLYPLVKSDCNKSAALKLIGQCALFPFYTVLTSGNQYSMSTLQITATEALENFDCDRNLMLLSEYLLLLNKLVLPPHVGQDSSDTNESAEYDEKSVKTKKAFSGLSSWAQDTMLEILSSGNDQLPDNEQIVEIAPPIVKTMNTVLKHGSTLPVATKIILRILELSDSLDTFKDGEIVESVRTSLDVSDNVVTSDERRQIIEFLDSFIDLVKQHQLPLESWESILKLILAYSVIYERTIHNQKYYENFDPNDTAALEYGTTEAPKLLHSEKISFFCIRLLCSLGCDSQIYSELAMSLFRARSHAVLYQYIGDCKLLGQEPLRQILRNELNCVLSELVRYAQGCEVLDPELRRIVLEAMAGAVHNEFQGYFREMLLRC